MIKIKEGFKGERLISLPDELLDEYSREPLNRNLYLRKIGFFPKVKFHYVQKEQGVDYAMLIYCVGGRGWVTISGISYEVSSNQYIFIPPGTPHSFGADASNPWSIYWIHFKGDMCKEFIPSNRMPVAILPERSSRIQERLELFEEIYSNFAIAYTKDHMTYVSMCLYRFLATFTHTMQYRYIKTEHKELSVSAILIRYMQENIGRNISLADLSDRFRYSQSHISALFHKETGMSPINYFIRLKVQRACEYIELTDMKMHEISTKLGYTEPTYFTRIFSKVMGMSPAQYRKQNRNIV